MIGERKNKVLNLTHWKQSDYIASAPVEIRINNSISKHMNGMKARETIEQVKKLKKKAKKLFIKTEKFEINKMTEK